MVTVNAQGKLLTSTILWTDLHKSTFTSTVKGRGQYVWVCFSPFVVLLISAIQKIEVSGFCMRTTNSLSIWECRSLTITWSCPSVISLRSVGFRLLFIRHSLMWGMCGSWGPNRHRGTFKNKPTWQTQCDLWVHEMWHDELISWHTCNLFGCFQFAVVLWWFVVVLETLSEGTAHEQHHLVDDDADSRGLIQSGRWDHTF